jgi:predicted dehydrogenase
MAVVSLVIIGAGERGAGYARWARRHPDRAAVVGVAEPRQARRARFAAACRRIVAAVEEAGVMLAVGHVMRYTSYTRAVKAIVASGQLGDIMSVQHLEPLGSWHQAHSGPGARSGPGDRIPAAPGAGRS